MVTECLKTPIGECLKPVMAQILFTRYGCKYYDRLPVNYVKAQLSDFTKEGKRKIGMRFLIQWISDEDIFQICEVSLNLTSEFLKPFIEGERVYILTEQ